MEKKSRKAVPGGAAFLHIFIFSMQKKYDMINMSQEIMEGAWENEKIGI